MDAYIVYDNEYQYQHDSWCDAIKAVTNKGAIMIININKVSKLICLGVCAVLLTQGNILWAADIDSTNQTDLERKVQILYEEIEQLKGGDGVSAEQSLRMQNGVGPAASKVYNQNLGVSLAGYGEVLYDNYASLKDDGSAATLVDKIDYLRQILYVGYKYSDNLLFNSEIEFEHGDTSKSGVVEIEFGYIDYLFNPLVNLRSGLVLMPVGIYNELHEPPVFYSTRRPEVEQKIIPTTWRANGMGIYGDIGKNIQYSLYLSESLNVYGSSANITGSGIRNARQSGSVAYAEDFAISGRVDYEWWPGAEVGVSFINGGIDQSRLGGIQSSLFLWDIHSRISKGPWEFRALYVNSSISNADQLNSFFGYTGSSSIASGQSGGYVEGAFDILSLLMSGSEQSIYLHSRYETFNTQSRVADGFSASSANDKQYLVYGLSWLPHPNVAFKIDYQNETLGSGLGTDSWRAATTYLF